MEGRLKFGTSKGGNGRLIGDVVGFTDDVCCKEPGFEAGPDVSK